MRSYGRPGVLGRPFAKAFACTGMEATLSHPPGVWFSGKIPQTLIVVCALSWLGVYHMRKTEAVSRGFHAYFGVQSILSYSFMGTRTFLTLIELKRSTCSWSAHSQHAPSPGARVVTCIRTYGSTIVPRRKCQYNVNRAACELYGAVYEWPKNPFEVYISETDA